MIRARGINVPECNDTEIILYVEALFAPTIARGFGKSLLDPPEDWLVKVPAEFLKRNIAITTLGQARTQRVPTFVKPPNDKSFSAEVYESGSDLPIEFDDEMLVLMAEPVTWEAEYRCFCLDGKVRTVSPYLRSGVLAEETEFKATEKELTSAKAFAEDILHATQQMTPRAIVIDVGTIEGRGWAVVEANGAWGSGIYGCKPDAVLDVIRYATVDLI
ncbi:ATP-grasp domain-containing protein [Calycomorphotria hydatis]|uniref:ATP-grasp domain-containing protein n=1 Tax=Calycomorphotria hydatis TaxID=2528027 RepID=UPI0018D22C46|nr:ATP-grasp domain-containing protein [Calycomorphotria hydatis]